MTDKTKLEQILKNIEEINYIMSYCDDECGELGIRFSTQVEEHQEYCRNTIKLIEQLISEENDK